MCFVGAITQKNQPEEQQKKWAAGSNFKYRSG